MGADAARSAPPPLTLAARLLLAFGLVAILATALVGVSLRTQARELIEVDFASRIDAAASGVEQELAYEAEALRGLLAPLCEHDTFVDKALLELERAKGQVRALDTERLIGIRHFVPEEARARGMTRHDGAQEQPGDHGARAHPRHGARPTHRGDRTG